jgi:hypothetical protein
LARCAGLFTTASGLGLHIHYARSSGSLSGVIMIIWTGVDDI